MDAGYKDEVILKLQSELDKLKEVFKCSSASYNWGKSEKVCRCTDQEFDDLLKTLSANELEAATLILRRHIDLEQQISKCLENLKAVQSGWDGRNSDVTQKIITSQSKVARLRSRFLRCITQQLQKNGSIASELPPWSAADRNIRETMEETNKAEPEKPGLVSSKEHPQTPVGKNTTAEVAREVEGSQDMNLVYSNVEDVRDLATSTVTAQLNLQAQADQTIHPKPGITELHLEESKENENDLYETIFPSQPSRPAPPKPLPYSLSKKLSDTAGESCSEKVLEKEEKPADIQLAATDLDDEPDALVIEQQHLQNWDPTPVLQELYGNVRPLPTPPLRAMGASGDNIRMAGYMEKQPVRGSMKRASVFKSWKKRHFKAVEGKLYYYEDHRAVEPLGFVNLVGCVVKKVDDKMLEVVEQNEGGRSVKLKCSSVKEADDWREALEAESTVPVDSRHVPEESPVTEGTTIIIDLGSSAVKAGFALEDAWPQVIFPCVIAVDKENEENCKYGQDALLPETRKMSRLCFPLRKSLKIDKLKFEILDLIGIFEHVFYKLKVNPSKHKVIMTLPHASGPQEKEELVELLLDHFQVEACYLQEQAILAMYSYSAISGIVVDIGNHIDIIPVVEGCMIEAGTTRLPYGGRQITDSFTRLLTEKGVRFFSEVESYISQAIKEKVSFVARRGTQDDDEPDGTLVVDLEKFSIPDGTRSVTVDTARHRCTEGLFKPSVWGKDNPGIHELTFKAIMACSIDIRKQMCRNIYLSGGGSMSKGLAERLQEEVSALIPTTSHVQVHAGHERHNAAYIGASVVARLPLFEELCVFKDDWDEDGPDALLKWLTL